MKIDVRLGGILTSIALLAIVAIDARAIPDFYTDRDLRGWHEYGLEKFYGPWAVIATNSNGDLIKYADYGSPIPEKYRPISLYGEDDELLEFLDAEEPSVRNDTGHADNPTGKSTLELVGIIGVIERTENYDEIENEPVPAILTNKKKRKQEYV